MADKLFADDPILTQKEDTLHREDFAKRVSKACESVSKESSSSVTALVGAWGSGKTSILNLAQKILKDEDWLVAEYNPWLISDIESLLLNFFSEILHAIPGKSKGADRLRTKIGSYAQDISPLGKMINIPGIDLASVADIAGKIIAGNQSLTAKRDSLSKELEKLKKPILVVIDDLDRLQPDELLMVFKLVRLVGRLPNIHYLLSYDEQTLLDVLAQTDLAKGDNARAKRYIEKIVQVRLDIPVLSEYQQGILVDASLATLLKRNNIEVLEGRDERRLQSAYRDCLRHYLDQPRSIKHFFAQIDALYGMVGSEVNFVDFSLMTFLRTFESGAYKLVYENRSELIGQNITISFHDESDDEREKRWREKITDAVDSSNESYVYDLLTELFPSVGRDQHVDSLRDDRIMKRICSADYFDRYFTYSVLANDVKDDELTAAVQRMNDDNNTQKLKEIINDNPQLTLRKLEDLQNSTNLSPVPTIELLCGEYLKFVEEDRSPLMTSLSWISQDMIVKSFKSLSYVDSRVVVDRVTKSLAGLTAMIQTYIRGHKEKEPELDNRLREIITSRLKNRMNKLSHKEIAKFKRAEFNLFYAYQLLAGNEALTEWLWNGVEEYGWDPIFILSNLVSEATTLSGEDAGKKVIGEIQNSTITEYFGIDRLLEHEKEALEKVDLSDDYEYRHTEPTLDNKRGYVLNRLKHIQDNRTEVAASSAAPLPEAKSTEP